ncbi:MAG: carbohydrate-binding family 9-like protein [Nannocystis sp.]|nr:carbohydrate-binding family 9-like protein [Nannocystis sp.]
MQATIELPGEWHAEHGVLVVEPRRGHSPVTARTGPRIDRGPGVFAVLPVATRPRQVVATQVATGALTIDGRIEEAAWAERPALLLADSLDGEPDEEATAIVPGALGEDALQAGRGTTLRLAWDAEFLYVAASLPDADLWTEYTAQDEPLYKQEAFEWFVAGTGEGSRYLEYQVSARGVTFDARFPRYRAGDEAWDSSWRTAVAVWGTLDVGGDRDRGWSVEAAIPWTELCEHTELRCPPAPGMRLRVNAFRLERPDRKRSDALALSPTRAPDFHAWANAAELELQ